MATKATRKSTTGTKTTKAKATSAGRRRSTTKPASSAPRDVAKPKQAAASTPAQAPSVAPERASPAVAAVPAEKPVMTASEALRRPDLIQAVADRVSLKRSEAKMVFDVVLDEIGKALDSNEEVIVPPLGKLMVKKRIEKPGGEMLTLKLKRAGVDPTAGDVAPLAKPDEQG